MRYIHKHSEYTDLRESKRLEAVLSNMPESDFLKATKLTGEIDFLTREVDARSVRMLIQIRSQSREM